MFKQLSRLAVTYVAIFYMLLAIDSYPFIYATNLKTDGWDGWGNTAVSSFEAAVWPVSVPCCNFARYMYDSHRQRQTYELRKVTITQEDGQQIKVWRSFPRVVQNNTR